MSSESDLPQLGRGNMPAAHEFILVGGASACAAFSAPTASRRLA